MAKKEKKPDTDYLLFVLVATAVIAGIVIMIISGTSSNNYYVVEEYNLGGQALLSCNQCLEWCNDGGSFSDPCWRYCVMNNHCIRSGTLA